MEPLSIDSLFDTKEDRYYFVGKIRVSGDSLHLHFVNGDKEPAKGAGNRHELEAVIAKHINAESLYLDAMEFKKCADRTLVDAVLEAFHAS